MVMPTGVQPITYDVVVEWMSSIGPEAWDAIESPAAEPTAVWEFFNWAPYCDPSEQNLSQVLQHAQSFLATVRLEADQEYAAG